VQKKYRRSSIGWLWNSCRNGIGINTLLDQITSSGAELGKELLPQAR
jgi:hypothetical protein